MKYFVVFLIILFIWLCGDILHYCAYRFCKHKCSKCKNWMCKFYHINVN